MEEAWECDLELQKPIISCEGMEFYLLKDAAKYFKLSSERIRQKLKDSSHSDYIYLY